MNCVFTLVHLLRIKPRRVIAENLGPFKPTCCVSLIFISYIYISCYKTDFPEVCVCVCVFMCKVLILIIMCFSNVTDNKSFLSNSDILS